MTIGALQKILETPQTPPRIEFFKFDHGNRPMLLLFPCIPPGKQGVELANNKAAQAEFIASITAFRTQQKKHNIPGKIHVILTDKLNLKYSADPKQTNSIDWPAHYHKLLAKAGLAEGRDYQLSSWEDYTSNDLYKNVKTFFKQVALSDKKIKTKIQKIAYSFYSSFPELLTTDERSQLDAYAQMNAGEKWDFLERARNYTIEEYAMLMSRMLDSGTQQYDSLLMIQPAVSSHRLWLLKQFHSLAMRYSKEKDSQTEPKKLYWASYRIETERTLLACQAAFALEFQTEITKLMEHITAFEKDLTQLPLTEQFILMLCIRALYFTIWTERYSQPNKPRPFRITFSAELLTRLPEAHVEKLRTLADGLRSYYAKAFGYFERNPAKNISDGKQRIRQPLAEDIVSNCDAIRRLGDLSENVLSRYRAEMRNVTTSKTQQEVQENSSSCRNIASTLFGRCFAFFGSPCDSTSEEKANTNQDLAALSPTAETMHSL